MLFLKIDNKIEEYIPGYKETISSNGSKIYNNVKEKLVTLYLDISTEICKNHENGCNTAKEIFKDIKDNCRIGWDFVKKLVSSGTSKLKKNGMRFIVENKIIKFLCIVVSLLCCGCSATVNNKKIILLRILSLLIMN